LVLLRSDFGSLQQSLVDRTAVDQQRVPV